MLNDTYRHKGLRRQLAALLKEKGITGADVLKAIEAVPRHLFLNSSFIERAYEDIAFPIGSGQTISRPHTVAFQTELLQLKKGEKVLEVGTGSGYQTSVLIEMGVKVYSIERQKALFDTTKTFLPSIGYTSAKLFYGDGYKGLPVFAPFDKIIITAGAPSIPNDLLDQLKVGGIMIIPLGDKVQTMTLLHKTAEKKFEKVEYGEFKFVPLLEDKEWGA
ncbi:MAG: protein-L-isoaspartate(D-aspartate) O-methyltransferase [Bacteroidetes bacterium]|nr:protein-L-isoaspartate(D-aspartate) O-methyltransferase [Bacteroidota bacterium]